MSNKDLCEQIADIIAMSKRPVIVSGEIYKERRGDVKITEDIRDTLLEVIARLHCRKVEIGSYECYSETMFGFSCDTCLTPEINRLNNEGIRTIGCCCGHGQKQGYIQVAPEFTEIMLKKGYEQIPIDEHGFGQWCFKPKTQLPKGANYEND